MMDRHHMNLQQVQSTKHQKYNIQIRTLEGRESSLTAHKDTLCSFSSVLQSECSKSNTVLIPNFSSEVVSAFLVYICNPTEEILESHNLEFLLQLHSFALQFEVRKLQKDIISVLDKFKISQKNILEVAGVLEDGSCIEEVSDALQRSVEKFIAENLKSAEDLAKVVTGHLNSSGVLNIPIRKLMKDDKKTVRFSDLVQRQIFNTNSAILAKTAKNKKKAIKKRKAQERRISEMEASSVEETTVVSEDIVKTGITAESFDDCSNDSGFASSLEENTSLNFDDVGEDMVYDEEEDSLLKISNEFIFDLDF